jgi:glycosyltransferase involved in cell wall biosynthesis
VLICHNLEDHETTGWKRSLTRAAFTRADAFVAHSRQGARALAAEHPGRPVAVLPMPVPDAPALDAARARRRLGVDGPLALFLGLIRPYKGVDLLLEAAPRIVAETGARIAIVGEVFRAARPLEKALARSPVRDRILWQDRYVSEEEMAMWLAAADVVVLPYTRISASAIAARSFGARRPVVAAAVGGLAEAVVPGITGELFPAGDASALAAAVRTALQRGPAAYAAGLEAAAREASWPSYTEGILGFLQSVAYEKHARQRGGADM